jgi:release factor glutamine methyltransferase
MTVRELLSEGKQLLAVPSPSSFIDTPDLDAALLLANVLRCRREELIVHGNDKAGDEDREHFLKLVERRRNGECVAYILGRKEFRGLDFSVNPQVLVPRPDTEILAEAALEQIDNFMKEKNGNVISLLDLCTGSGALAISLKNERPSVEVSASDIAPGVLETAVRNAGRLLDEGLSPGKPKTVRFIQSDIFQKIHDKFNIIVSNPPYVPSDKIATLAPEVRREPRLSLDGGVDGLDLIKKIISGAKDHLHSGGVLLLEADPDQMIDIHSLLKTQGFHGITIRKDLAGNERVISAKAP